MRFNDRDAFEERCVRFQEEIDTLITKDRTSRMAEASQKALMKTINKNATQNEKTLLNLVVPKVVKESRVVSTGKHTLDGNVINFVRDYDDDQLHSIQESIFVKDLVPGKNYSSHEKTMGLTNPSPDWTFGVQEDHCPMPEKQHSPSVLALIGVSPGMLYPFLVIETKSAEDGIAVAENQAIRDGAVLVNARMRLNEMAKPADYVRPVGAAHDSYAFSCAWVPDMAKIFVHWFEKKTDGCEIFHMNMIHSYLMSLFKRLINGLNRTTERVKRMIDDDLHVNKSLGFPDRNASHRVSRSNPTICPFQSGSLCASELNMADHFNPSNVVCKYVGRRVTLHTPSSW